MAIKCANCGQVLPRDNARFCNSCGYPTFSEEDTIFPDDSDVFPEDSLEDLPTAHMEANFPEPPIQKPIGMQGARELKSAPQAGAINPAPTGPDSDLYDVTQLSTSRLGVQFNAPPSAPRPVSRQGMSRKRLVLVLTLLFVLVVGGIAAWLVAIKPFAVASITQPWQQFCDSGLGVFGQYPTGWAKQIDSNKAVHFSDGTDQFSIVSVAANGEDAGTYLRKEASQLGITSLKLGTPASFAGTSWQQAQGSLLSSQTGVTYTETLLVTVHGNRFFTIMQIAPPGTYREEDTTIFSGMRSSFQFNSSCP